MASIDGATKTWYVEAGTGLEPLRPWLPDDAPVSFEEEGGEGPQAGIGLREYLARLDEAVLERFPQAAWVRAKISPVTHKPFLALDLVELDRNGSPQASRLSRASSPDMRAR